MTTTYHLLTGLAPTTFACGVAHASHSTFDIGGVNCPECLALVS